MWKKLTRSGKPAAERLHLNSIDQIADTLNP
jgi:hypothetical protein